MKLAAAQDMRRHRGRRGFTVHPRDDDAALSEHNGSERFGPPHRRHSARTGIGQDRIVLFDRGGINDQLGIGRILRAMWRESAEPELGEAFGLERARLVGTAHIVPELEEQSCDPAHPAPGHADQVNGVVFLGEEPLQVEIRRRQRHADDCTFPSYRRPNWPRFSARARRLRPTSCAASPVRSGDAEFFSRADRRSARIP